MKNRLFAILLAIVGMLPLASCSKNDGDWDPMKWEKHSYEQVATPSFGKAIGVPRSGGSYTFTCKNYKSFWIESITEEQDGKYIKTIPERTGMPEVNGSYTTSKVEGNTLSVAFAPNETLSERYTRIGISAGDTFYKFVFMQKP